MPYEWIKAPLALEYVSEAPLDYSAMQRICERAHHGLIVAKAQKLVSGEQELIDHVIGKGFWWAEGHEALEQDWQVGDFSTWIDQKQEVKAFGVSFDFVGISELVPADRQAAALRRISVCANDQWISARELHMLFRRRTGPHLGTAAMVEACRLGQVGARAMRATRTVSTRDRRSIATTHIEWDVPLWFWRDFAVGEKAHFQFGLDKVHGRGVRDGISQTIELQGIHFHRSGLAGLGFNVGMQASDDAAETRRGRKPEYDWPAASTAMWGMIYRGELLPANQAMIEKALQAHLSKGDAEPSESTVRPHAKRIWDEYSKA